MSWRPAVYTSTHRIRFSDLDPYRHMRTAMYSAYYVDHRMEALRVQAGWDMETLERLPFMAFVRRLDVSFIRPVIGDQEIRISSFVREFAGPDAHIQCTMTDRADKVASEALMIVAYVDRTTRRAGEWPHDVMALFEERRQSD